MILMNDFKAEPLELRQAMHAAARRVIDSGWYVLGKEVETFEKTWASVCGVSRAVGVGNGMDAIEIALRALDIGIGDEVITTPMTAFATVLAIIRSGATPVLADIEPDSALLSLDSVKRCVNSKTKAIVLVHLYGQVRSMNDWTSFCDMNGIHLIEDCAQAHLARWNGEIAGGFGVAGAYSFYPTKNLGAPGDAGMLVTDNTTLADRAARLRNYGQSVRYQHPELGMNSRLDELQAAILSERVKWLDEFTDRRREIATAYFSGICSTSVRTMARPEHDEAHVFHLFVVVCPQRDALKAHLASLGVQALIHYPLPVHEQLSCREIKRDARGLIMCEEHANQCLSLPCHPQMTDQQISQVIDAINAFECE